MNSFSLTIVESKRIVYQGQARACTVSTTEGSQGLEAHHEDLMAVLQSPSTISFQTDSGSDQHLEIKSGLLSFVRNECRIIIQSP